MTLELRDVLTLLSIGVAVLSVLLVNRNNRRMTNVQAQNVDLTRIRDLRHELSETKNELTQVKGQVTALESQIADLAEQLTAANERSLAYARREMEMVRYAQMPGVTIEDWRDKFGSFPPEIATP